MMTSLSLAPAFLGAPAYCGLVELDRAWTLALNALHCPASDSFWVFMSQVKVWYAFYALVAALLIWRLGWKRGLVYILAAVLSVVATDQLCNLVKDNVCRLRPSSDPEMMAAGLYALIPPSSHIYGFFSAHAANAFGFATLTFLSLREAREGSLEVRGVSGVRRTGAGWIAAYGVFVYVWAALVAVSRVFCGKHFIGDILVGAIVGCLVAWGLFCLGRLAVRRLIG